MREAPADERVERPRQRAAGLGVVVVLDATQARPQARAAIVEAVVARDREEERPGVAVERAVRPAQREDVGDVEGPSLPGHDPLPRGIALLRLLKARPPGRQERPRPAGDRPAVRGPRVAST